MKTSTKNKPGIVLLAAALMGAILLVEGTVRVVAAAPTGIKNVVLVHGTYIRRRLRLGSCRQDPREGWLHGVGGATPRDLLATPTTKSTRRRPSTPWAARSSWSATATAGPSSPRPATIQMLRRWFTSPPLRSMTARAVRPSNRPCRKPPRHSNRTATGFGGLTRRISPPTSRQTFHGKQAEFMRYISRCRSLLDSVHPQPGYESRLEDQAYLGTWWPQQTGRSIRTRERMMAKRANAKTIEVNSSHVAYMSHPKQTAKLIEEAAAAAPAVNQ